jgi:hypothetical protein
MSCCGRLLRERIELEGHLSRGRLWWIRARCLPEKQGQWGAVGEEGSGMDVPVSEAAFQVREGNMVFMAGGEKSIFEKIKPILDKMGKKTGSDGMVVIKVYEQPAEIKRKTA